ncbi:MAG TPA: diguanylate cyclase [Methylophilus sp.]|nr:diguanylate cyclase [Methylophilus sp.]HQQ33757.1 diguanylate cyclase [Methylophilus sp.]
MADINDCLTLFTKAFDSVGGAVDVLVLKDGQGRWMAVNEKTKQLFALQAVDWYGKTDTELAKLHPMMADMLESCTKNDEYTWSSRQLHVFEKTFRHEEDVFEFEMRKSPVFDSEGKRKVLITIGNDITERKRAERDMRVAEKAFDSLDAIIVTDADKRIIRVNNTFSRLTGYMEDEVLGKTPAVLKSGRHDAAFYQKMWETLHEKGVWRGEIWDKRKNGEIYPKWLSISAVTGEDGTIQNYVGTFNDLSGQVDAKEAIHRMAFYDSLTNVANRRLLNDRLNDALANSVCNQHFGAVLMLDVDNFKLINDTYGHEAGDYFLIEVARRLRYCTREEDTVARLGGDEFVILLEFLSQDAEEAERQVRVVAEKVLNEIRKSFLINGIEIRTSVSLGISMFTSPHLPSDEMLRRADAAMYRAKSSGRDRFCFFAIERQMQ